MQIDAHHVIQMQQVEYVLLSLGCVLGESTFFQNHVSFLIPDDSPRVEMVSPETFFFTDFLRMRVDAHLLSRERSKEVDISRQKKRDRQTLNR